MMTHSKVATEECGARSTHLHTQTSLFVGYLEHLSLSYADNAKVLIHHYVRKVLSSTLTSVSFATLL